MAASGVISQSLSGNTLTFTDTSTGVGTITSRILTIYDSGGTLLDTIDMGAGLTATYGITSDVYLTFVLTLTNDAAETYTVTVNYISVRFYKNAQAALAALLSVPCSCEGIVCSGLVKARESINAATTYFNIGDAASSQIMLTAADFYILNPTY